MGMAETKPSAACTYDVLYDDGNCDTGFFNKVCLKK